MDAPDLPFDLAQPYGLAAADKRPRLLATLNALSDWHAQGCPPYAAMRERLWGPTC